MRQCLLCSFLIPPYRIFNASIGCSIGSSRAFAVVSLLSDYDPTGEFWCSNNEILFYSNKTRVVSNKTKCLATAQWKDSDVAQCWAGKYCYSDVIQLNFW